MTEPKFASQAEAKKAGWFSRRHENRQAHDEAHERYMSRTGTGKNRGRRIKKGRT